MGVGVIEYSKQAGILLNISILFTIKDPDFMTN